MNCPVCNEQVLPGELFCDSCGSSLQESNSAAQHPQSSFQEVSNVPSYAEANIGSYESTTEPSSVSEFVPIQQTDSDQAALVDQTRLASSKNAQIVVKSGGTTYPLYANQEGTIIIGRMDPIEDIHPDIDLTPHDEEMGVSRQHAAIHEQGGQWYIADLDSTNYTVLDRTRLTPNQEYLLQDGDELRFALVAVTFQLV